MSELPNFQELLDRMTRAYRAGEAAACADMFTADAHLYSPYAPPALGRKAIETLHADWLQGGVDDKELQVLESGGADGSGWTLSRYSEDGGKIQGISLIVWQRDGDGTWRIRMCSLNGSENEVVI